MTYTQAFDAENRLVSVTVSGQQTSFIYDGDGNLVKKVNADNSRTLYVGEIYEVDKNSGGTVISTKTYYPVAGAMRVGSTLYYVLKDHLGSASVVTNSTGTTVGEDRFYPFGETRFTTGTMYTDKLFTGQRDMAGLGIYHYGARFYSPKLGRFLSADTIVPGYANPQNLNRFSYVRNNPLRYIDPTGHWVDEGCGTGGSGGGTGCNLPPPGRCTTCGGGGGGDEDDRRPPRGGGGGNPLPGPIPDPGDEAEDSLITVVPPGPSCWDYATSCTDLAGTYSPNLPGWHYYYNFNLVCPANIECNPTQMRDYLSRSVFPGQDPNYPVADGDSNFVPGLGFIRTRISVDGLMIVNITEPFRHLMYDGQVVRMAVQAPDGAWYVATTGTGNNISLPMVTDGNPFHPNNTLSWISLAPLNQRFGDLVFDNFDVEMLNYILANQ